MAKNLFLKFELLRWFATQKLFADRREMAKGIGIPYETLKGYFKRKSPRPENARRLSDVTGLNLFAIAKARGPGPSKESRRDLKRLLYAARVVDNLQFALARCAAALVPAKNALIQQAGNTRSGRTKSAQAVQSLMDALQRSLEPFLDDPEALVALRQSISGSDAGYLSGLLGAVFDDRRLQRWREMTTYQYGSK